jgi:hypothetical protein
VLARAADRDHVAVSRGGTFGGFLVAIHTKKIPFRRV